MPSYHLNTSNDAEEIYTGKHVGIHRNSTHHYKTGKLPSFILTFTGDLTAHCATRHTRNKQAILYIKLGPHKHRYNKQATT